jgi:hypothetical protein
MATELPQRPSEHQLEDESFAFFLQHLPRGWTCDRPQHDYGVDLRVGLAEDGRVNGQQLVVQLKATATAPPGGSVALVLSVPTLNYLRAMLEVALVVKYVADESEAYWLLLKDFTIQLGQGQKTVTIRLPRANRITDNPWPRIAAHVQAVHYRKLQANTSVEQTLLSGDFQDHDQPTAAPVPTTSTPVLDKWLIVPGVSMSDVAVGLDVDEAISRLGPVDSREDFDDCYYLNYFSKGMSLRIENRRVVCIYAHSNFDPLYTPYLGTTATGISVWSTPRQVETIYGHADTRLDVKPDGIIDIYYRLGLSFHYELTNASKGDQRIKNIWVHRQERRK